MPVHAKELPKLIEQLSKEKYLSLDCESSGIQVWKKDRLFSIAIASETDTYYLNWGEYPDNDPWTEFAKEQFLEVQKLLDQEHIVWRLFNAKFDMALLHKEGLEIKGEIRDPMVQARLIYNDHMKYSLAECAKREGLEKSDEVEKYIEENGLWEWDQQPGKKVRHKKKFFDKVPISIMEKYARQDARITFDLGKLYDTQLQAISDSTPTNLPNITTVANNEYKLTKTLFEMEKHGIKIDKEYCNEAYKYEARRAGEAAQEFTRISGRPFVDSNKHLAETFALFGEAGGRTQKNNPRFDEASLSAITTGSAGEIAKSVLGYREASKGATTYYQNFLWQADTNGKVHCNFRQAGTATGRMSATEPAMQTIPRVDDSKYKVKDSFVPSDGYCFFEIDFDNFEYRLMVEYANETTLAEKINQGLDVHTETAKLMGITDRNHAKTIAFMLLYGGSARRLSEALSIDLQQAQELKQKYFSTLPKIKKFLYAVSDMAKQRGYLFNWIGRRCHLKPDFSYKGPNALIQSSCADITKLAMNRCYDFLLDKKSRMILQVHDSILFEVHYTELEIVNELKNILEKVYPSRIVSTTVSAGYSWKSWGSLVPLKNGTHIK